MKKNCYLSNNKLARKHLQKNNRAIFLIPISLT